MDEVININISFEEHGHSIHTREGYNYIIRKIVTNILSNTNDLAINRKFVKDITVDINTLALLASSSSFAHTKIQEEIGNNVGSFAGFNIKLDASLFSDIENEYEYQYVLTCEDNYTKHIIINRDIQKMRERDIDRII